MSSQSLVWSTKEGRRAAALGKLLKWPAVGALVAVGAIGIATWWGPPVVRELGRRGGEGFAEGMANMQRQLQVSGWGRYR